ncbi:hypothetical protein [Kribbella voronezhensis]|nr:hypothetical protein [Kribbella voronezhensis]
MSNHLTSADPATPRGRMSVGDRVVLVAAAVVLAVSGIWLAASTATAASNTSGDTAAVTVASVAAASPSPLPAGDSDGDASDWTGTPLVFVGLLAVLLVAASVIVVRYRSHRSKPNREQR